MKYKMVERAHRDRESKQDAGDDDIGNLQFIFEKEYIMPSLYHLNGLTDQKYKIFILLTYNCLVFH